MVVARALPDAHQLYPGRQYGHPQRRRHLERPGHRDLTNSTLTDNTANDGGIYSQDGSITLQNTIVALNTAIFTSSKDCFGTVTSLGTNLIGDLTGCTITRPQGGGDLTGDPGLDTFTDDGTPGHRHFPLLETSQAIDAGNDVACPPTDQLGQPRVDQCDIGAIEFQPNDTTRQRSRSSL